MNAPPKNLPITYRGKTFRLFMTSRGPLHAKNHELRTLRFIPERFHKYITVVTGEEHRVCLAKKYPNLPPMWSTPSIIDSAAKKRSLVMSSYEEDYCILMNDNMSIHCHDSETGKFLVPTPELFRLHLRSFLDLCLSDEGFGGVALHAKAFSKQVLDSSLQKSALPEAYSKRINFIGGFFCIKKRITANSRFHLGRLDYYEDIDYSLQLLSLGFNTVKYLGMVFENPKAGFKTPHSDRTLAIRDRDRDLLISFFPEYARKRPPEKLRDDLNIDIYVKYTKAYQNAKTKRAIV